jgi:hypothetical protein
MASLMGPYSGRLMMISPLPSQRGRDSRPGHKGRESPENNQARGWSSLQPDTPPSPDQGPASIGTVRQWIALTNGPNNQGRPSTARFVLYARAGLRGRGPHAGRIVPGPAQSDAYMQGDAGAWETERGRPVISLSGVLLGVALRDQAADAQAGARRRSATRGPGIQSRGTPRWRSRPRIPLARSRRRP